MNALLAASDDDRYRLSTGDVDALVRSGMMEADAPYELIDGVLLAMPSECFAHVDWKNTIVQGLYTGLDLQRFAIIADSTLRLSSFDAPEPDIYVYARDKRLSDLRGNDVALIIEVCVSTGQRDRVIKPALYARHGVKAYWVVDVDAGEIITHSSPSGDGWGETARFGFDDAVAAPSLNGFSVTLSGLPRLD